MEDVEQLERRIGALRAGVREAIPRGDKTEAATLRAQLRDAERLWELALDDARTQRQEIPETQELPERTARCYRCVSRYTRR